MQWRVGLFLSLSILSGLLSGCLGVSAAWTGANLLYDRHVLMKKMTNYQLVAQASRALYRDNCSIDLAALNGDLLLVGHVGTSALRDEAYARVAKTSGFRRLFNQLAVGPAADSVAEDTWITTKIRSQMVADSSLDPRQFKVITSDRVVYLMGDVFPEAAARVIYIARRTEGVIRVVTLLNYYHLSEKA